MNCKKNFVLCLLLALAVVSHAQVDTAQPPYKRFPHVPPFQMLLGDSATVYTKENLPKGKPLLLMLFSPECSHCQHTAEDIVKHKDSLQNIQIVMATLYTISQMNEFAETYGLKAMPNVVLGKDVHFILPPFFQIRNLPFMAFYKANGDLIQTSEGSLPIENVIRIFEKAER